MFECSGCRLPERHWRGDRTLERLGARRNPIPDFAIVN
jgi:hypothetical protein